MAIDTMTNYQIIMNHSKKINIIRMLPLLGCMACFIYNPAAMAQTVVVTANPVVTPVITANPMVNTNVNPKVSVSTNVNPAITTNVNPNVSTSINPVVTTNVNPDVSINANPNVNIDVNPDVNVDTDRSEGSWFATIKGDKIRIEFRSSDDENNWSSDSDFKLSDFPNLQKGQKGEFSLKREAGIVVFTGMFDGDMGSGHYKFTADNSFVEYVKSHGFTNLRDRDPFSFYMVDLKKSYVEMLQKNG
jgi:hypothetical protein